ncbi:hypothetical protein TNCV_2003161 [Trichonephila clavipes]|nr:hypothetical protein TNCV_2003161 [Trichonephila clavipes]
MESPIPYDLPRPIGIAIFRIITTGRVTTSPPDDHLYRFGLTDSPAYSLCKATNHLGLLFRTRRHGPSSVKLQTKSNPHLLTKTQQAESQKSSVQQQLLGREGNVTIRNSD